MHGIDPGDDLGVIVRTVSAGVTQATLKNDLVYLKRTWAEVRKKATEVKAPACVYREPGLPERAIRDYLTDDVTEVWVDDADMAERIRNTVALLFPNKKELVRLHNDTRRSMWERFNLRRQLDQIYSREVLMPSGGRLCFDQTEALMAIDINSGKISGKGNFEAMAFKTNMEAAETIARQLKLRDIGGQVVIDFIEMKEHKHVAEVERTLRNAMKYDRARHDVAHMSSFGLLELVRQRTGNSAISISMEPCPACGGKRYKDSTLEVKIRLSDDRDYSIADVLDMTADAGAGAAADMHEEPVSPAGPQRYRPRPALPFILALPVRTAPGTRPVPAQP